MRPAPGPMPAGMVRKLAEALRDGEVSNFEVLATRTEFTVRMPAGGRAWRFAVMHNDRSVHLFDQPVRARRMDSPTIIRLARQRGAAFTAVAG